MGVQDEGRDSFGGSRILGWRMLNEIFDTGERLLRNNSAGIGKGGGIGGGFGHHSELVQWSSLDSQVLMLTGGDGSCGRDGDLI